MKIDITRPLYCIDKETGGKYKVSSIFFPINARSGKNVTIEIGDDTEWRAIEDIELIDNTI